MSWPQYKLDELGSVSRGRSRHRPRDAAHLYGGPYPFVQTSDVKHSGLYLTKYQQTYSEEGLAQSKIWPVGTLCITIAANIADTSILGIEACFPDSVIGFFPDPKKADARFIKYLFDATLKRRYSAFTQGAAQENLSQGKLLSLEFPVPNVDRQQSIADTLSAYDELIENNRRRIALLEETAQQLYKEWFVRFRFPGHEHVKIIDVVPEGWERRTASEALEINPKPSVEKGLPISHVSMRCLSEAGMTVDKSAFEVRTNHTSVKFQNGDTLFARITPCLENGKTAYVNFLAGDEVACGSTEFIVFRGKRVSNEFAYLLAREQQFRANAIKSMIGSSGRQRVQPSCFDRYIVPIAPPFLQEEFDDAIKPLFHQICILSQQNANLSTARDLLLPKLMNGELAA